jgi:hypothetical protein
MSDCRNDFLRASHALSALRANEIEGCQDGVAVTRISVNSGLNTLALSRIDCRDCRCHRTFQVLMKHESSKRVMAV